MADPDATMMAAAWDTGLCQLSDMGKGQLNSSKTPICLVYCVVVFCYVEALPRWWLFHRKPGDKYFVATCETVAGLYFLCRERGRTVSADCMACGGK